MSTRIDILAAKGAYEAHVAAHKCRPRLLAIADGEVPCDKRLELLRGWYASTDSAAGRWGIEATDGPRIAEMYAAQTASLAEPGTTWQGMRRAA